MSMALVHFGWTFLLTTASAMALSIWKGVCSRLLMAEFLKNDGDVDSLMSSDEEGCEFIFGG